MKKETKSKAIEWGATALSITGAILNAFLMKEGFYVWGISNLLWMVFAFKNKHWGMFITFSVYFVINLIGIAYW